MALKSQKEAERAEQQRIKNLVLNYDLTDSSTDQTGVDGEKQQPPHHAHNAPLQQSPIPNSANGRPTERSGGGRRGQQARKLQLSDVDWYESRPIPEKSDGQDGSWERVGRRRG
ncbi:MAG: hypothetical protein LQ338_000141 [Usnochroma carphineum]|nr:MAG: hypothetical protein LQ338_000141 [Usnochroma carphineum]